MNGKAALRRLLARLRKHTPIQKRSFELRITPTNSEVERDLKSLYQMEEKKEG